MKKYPFSPGPTPIPEEVLLEMAKPIIHHRTEEFSAVLRDTINKLKPVFGIDKGEVVILAGSGSAGMEASFINTVNCGDKVLVASVGKFGERWLELAKAYGADLHTIEVEWGSVCDPKMIDEFLSKNSDTKAVFIQASETSTTAYNPVDEIGEVVKKYPNTILVVDGITSVGVNKIEAEKYGLDIVIAGSQKGFMLPPGLAIVSLTPKALAMLDKSTQPKYYLNLKEEIKYLKKDTTTFTPPVSLIMGLNKVLNIMHEEGLDNIYKRHKVNSDAVIAAGKAIGLKLICEKHPSYAATGFFVPETIDGEKFVNYLRVKLGLTYAGGQDKFKGKIIRISHLGYHEYFDTVMAVSGLEFALAKFGYTNFALGDGVKAAMSVIKDYLPNP